ncbi:MAG: DUF4259 domain-containing protein [Phycisphaeraceae bacterium]|nr:DUF4259 domain-containing protein [Phycisphaeraceae bacterium]
MGAWGVKNFENDTALDWVLELTGGEDPGMIRETLEMALGEGVDGDGEESEAGEDEYLEEEVCSSALAAAEIVAALRGRPASDLPDGAREWIGRHGHRIKVDRDLIDTAHDAIARVAADSELCDLWMESEHATAWEEALQDLQRRIGTD